jgi:hypothetical protein
MPIVMLTAGSQSRMSSLTDAGADDYVTAVSNGEARRAARAPRRRCGPPLFCAVWRCEIGSSARDGSGSAS